MHGKSKNNGTWHALYRDRIGPDRGSMIARVMSKRNKHPIDGVRTTIHERYNRFGF